MTSTIALGTTLLMGLFYSWTSRINGQFFFARTVQPGFTETPAARTILRLYRRSIGLATLGSMALAWALCRHGRALGGISFFVEVLAFFAIFGRANGRVRDLQRTLSTTSVAPVAVVEVDLLQAPRYWVPGPMAVAAPVVAAGLSFLAALVLAARSGSWAARWDALTGSLDAHGMAKLLGVGCGMLFAAVAVQIVFRISVRLRTRLAQYSMRSSYLMECAASLLLIALLAIDRSGILLTRTFAKGFVGALILGTAAVMVWNQARSKRFVPAPVELGDDDRWRWGLFYVDPTDPALLVQSRCGAGFTLNYGKILAWPIAFAFCAYLIAMIVVSAYRR